MSDVQIPEILKTFLHNRFHAWVQIDWSFILLHQFSQNKLHYSKIFKIENNDNVLGTTDNMLIMK